MTTTFEKLSSNKVKLGFTVEPEKFDEGLQTAYRKLVRQISIPGFRRGKAPMRVIESHYGPSVFYEDAFEAIFPEIYRAGLEEHGVEPVDSPELDIEQIGRGKELKFTVEVFVRPDVELGEYKHLGLKKEAAEVTDDDVNADIERARERAARYVEITDRPAKLDDQVNIDYAGYLGDVQFDGGTAKGHDLVLGSGSFIPGFEDQLVGANAGDEVDVNVTFPEDYHAEELAGKPVVFKVKVNSIREKDVPALDDDFVTEVSEKANTVDEYRAEIREKLEKRAEDNADRAFEDAELDAVSDNAEVDIPKAMIDDEVTAMLRDMEMRLAYQGMKLDDFAKYTGQTVDQLREQYRPGAEERVRKNLVLEAVMKAENIAATDEEVDKEIADYAARSGQKPEDLRKAIGEDGVKRFAEMASLKKTVDFLKANAE